MHTIKITRNLIFDYQCTSGKFIRLLNRIESKLFLPELECSAVEMTPIALVHAGGGTVHAELLFQEAGNIATMTGHGESAAVRRPAGE